MNFFTHQRHARRNTGRLIGLFALGLSCFIGSLYISAAVVLKMVGAWSPAGSWWNPAVLIVVTGLMLGVLGVHVWLKMKALKEQGGAAVAVLVGGRPIHHITASEAERALLNVVEEMAVAASLPVPWVYVLDQEPGINAFTAGFVPEAAVITVTNGALHSLSRDELQGVMAHEFSHILHGDMRLNTRLWGLLSGLTFLVTVGRWLMKVSLRMGSDNDASPLRLLLTALFAVSFFVPFFLYGAGLYRAAWLVMAWLIPLVGGGLLALSGGVGVLFSRLIQQAVARQREYLADAAAVQFTRYPQGLAGALEKIARHTLGAQILSPSASRASHFFFANPAAPSFFSGLLESHPPLKTRLRRLNAWPPPPTPESASPLPDPNADDFIDGLAGLTVERLDYGHAVLEHVPPLLYTHTHDPAGAQAIVFGLLLDAEEAVLQRQLSALDEDAAPAVIELLHDLLPDLNTLSPRARLPLIELVMPALRGLSPLQFKQFQHLLQALATADRQLSTFEFALYLLLKHWLQASAPSRRAPRTALCDVRTLLPDCAVLLSALAYLDDAKEKEARRAFEVGRLYLPEADLPIALLPRRQVTHASVEAALTRLGGLSMTAQRKVIEACAHCVLADGTVSDEEGELLRVIAVLLNTLLPSFLPSLS